MLPNYPLTRQIFKLIIDLIRSRPKLSFNAIWWLFETLIRNRPQVTKLAENRCSSSKTPGEESNQKLGVSPSSCSCLQNLGVLSWKHKT